VEEMARVRAVQGSRPSVEKSGVERAAFVGKEFCVEPELT
jgi:hypothetical protein